MLFQREIDHAIVFKAQFEYLFFKKKFANLRRVLGYKN
jgi:hypothetical protein